MNPTIEFGIDTFGDAQVDDDGAEIPQPQVIRNVVDQAVLADRVGIDVIGLGEHHRDDFAISAPEIVLAAMAARTERILLSTAVTILSSDDPVRVYERFATLAAISAGRAEIMVGRGSFTESFPLFGYSLHDYEILFDEKLELLAKLLEGSPVTWSGTTRTPLEDQIVYPSLDTDPIRTWVGVGGTPQSVVRAARYGFPLLLAVIGGAHERFKPLVELYHKALAEYGRTTQPVGCHSPGHVAETDEQAIEEAWPAYEVMHRRIAAERGWGPLTRAGFEAQCGPDGALCVGSPMTVALKIAATINTLGLSRFTLKVGSGPMTDQRQRDCIELYGTEVIPRVRELLSSQ